MGRSVVTAIGFAILGYLLGSVPFAVVVSRLYGLRDPRTYGSGNPGATNVLRSGSKSAAALTLLGDGFMGWLAVWLALGLGEDFGAGGREAAAAGLGAFLGHLYPIFLHFRGGKGVATAFGAIVGLSPVLGLAALLSWIGTALVTRYSSLAALVAAGVAALLGWFVLPSIAPAVAVTVIAGILAWRHQENIRRLRAGTEGRIGAS
ncbi:MAG: glycerol-3-phosphate 1-O-acyltransferase PlsY [Betaproteobacteria bacterium]|nr:glycerol-3-phosphate 1-O-acyltransferase PlsY [Betaproteobacteria bacterium]